VFIASLIVMRTRRVTMLSAKRQETSEIGLVRAQLSLAHRGKRKGATEDASRLIRLNELVRRDKRAIHVQGKHSALGVQEPGGERERGERDSQPLKENPAGYPHRLSLSK
jgi:hypothetical protein